MKLICDPEKGGCGRSIEMNRHVITAFWEAYQRNSELDCPNDACERKVTRQQIKEMVGALLKMQEKSKKVGTKRPTSGHIRVSDVPKGGRAYGGGR